MTHRCPDCPASPSHACHVLVVGLYHWCLQREHDPALSAYIAAESKEGCEPERRPPTRSGKPRVEKGINQKSLAKG